MEYTVGEEHIAEHLAKRGRKVLNTPCLVLLMERTARICLESRTGTVTVGYRVDVKHKKSVPAGARLIVSARIYYWDGRRALIYMRAVTPDGEIIGEGTNERFVLKE